RSAAASCWEESSPSPRDASIAGRTWSRSVASSSCWSPSAFSCGSATSGCTSSRGRAMLPSARPAFRSETGALPYGAPVVVLVNGAARSAGRTRWEPLVRKILGRRLDPQFLFPETGDDMARAAWRSAHAGAHAIIVAGGDGSVNRVVRALGLGRGCAALLVANQGSLGGGLALPTASRNDDGVFELCLVPAASRLRLLATLARLARGRADDLPVVRAREARIACDRPLVFFGDGDELVRGRAFTLRVRPAALRVIC